MSLKLFVVEHCKTAEYEYYVADRDEIVKVIVDNIDDKVWNLFVEHLEYYHNKNFTNDEITWDLIEEFNPGYMEEYDIAFYCETPITTRRDV